MLPVIRTEEFTMHHHQRIRTRHTAVLTVAVGITMTLTACGSDKVATTKAEPSTTAPPASPTIEPTTAVAPTTTSSAPATSVKSNEPATVINVVITDTSFEVSGPVRPGGVIAFKNSGVEAHSVQVRKISDGKSYDDALAQLNSQEGMDAITTELGAPGNVLTPGNSVAIAYPQLAAGDYILADWFPVEGDTTGKYHANIGVVGHLTVAGAPVESPTATETYHVVTGAPLKGSAVLSSGHHELHIVFDGTATGFPTVFALHDADNVASATKRLAQVFAQESRPTGTGVDMAKYLVTSTFGPMTGGNELTIGLDLQPGRYALVNLAYDNDGNPVVGPEQIEFTVT
jgi:hypothetical protein